MVMVEQEEGKGANYGNDNTHLDGNANEERDSSKDGYR